MDQKPSVIAAAATLVAMDQKLTMDAVELKMSSIPQHWLLEPVSSVLFFRTNPITYKLMDTLN